MVGVKLIGLAILASRRRCSYVLQNSPIDGDHYALATIRPTFLFHGRGSDKARGDLMLNVHGFFFSSR